MCFYKKKWRQSLDILRSVDIFILFLGFPVRHGRQKAHSDRAELQLENNSAAASTGIVGRVGNLELR